MKPIKNKRTVMVGLFVTIGIIILIVGVFTLGGQRQVFTPSMTVSAVFDNVNGLQKGDNVWFSGVKVGTVKEIRFHGTSQVLVEMHIEKSAQQYIRADSKARISSEGFIGNKLVVLFDGSQSSPPVAGGEVLQTETAINTDDMMATLQRNNNNLAAITSDLRMVSERLANGEGSLGALIKDDQFYRELQNTVVNLQKAARNSQIFTSSIADYASQLHKPGTIANDLVNDTVVMSRLKNSMVQVNDAAASIKAFSSQMKNTADQLSMNLNDDDSPLGVLLNDQQTAEDLRNLIGNLRVSSIRLDENLEALQHSIFLRGYFRKKAKEEDRKLEELKKAVQVKR